MHVWHVEKSIGIPQSLQDDGIEVQQLDDGLDKTFEEGKKGDHQCKIKKGKHCSLLSSLSSDLE